jgi:hypothetical protein
MTRKKIEVQAENTDYSETHTCFWKNRAERDFQECKLTALYLT